MANIKAEIRKESGKGVARKLRNENKVPAVLYSAGKEPVSLSIDGYDLMMAMQQGGFYTTKHVVAADGKKLEVLAKDIQMHPVTDKVQHVDFMTYNAKQEVRVNVNVTITGEEDSEGLQIGGVLQLLRSEIEVICRADNIPDEIIVSMAGKDIGGSVHLSDITFPEGSRSAVQDRDFTIASVVGTRSSTMEDLDAEMDAERTLAEGEIAEGEEGETPAEGEEAKEGSEESKDKKDK